MKKILFALICATTVSTAFACRPNIYAIENGLAIKALESVSTSITTLTSVKISNMRMAYVNRPSNGLNCPDFYEATVGLNYKDKCFSVVTNTSKEAPVVTESVCE